LTLERPGLAMFASAGGTFGPFELSDEASARLSALLRAAPTANADSGPGDVPSAGVAAGDVFFSDRGPDLEPIEPSVGCESRGPVQSPGSPAGSGGCDGGSPNPVP
jgi:hypothetical protein